MCLAVHGCLWWVYDITQCLGTWQAKDWKWSHTKGQLEKQACGCSHAMTSNKVPESLLTFQPVFDNPCRREDFADQRR